MRLHAFARHNVIRQAAQAYARTAKGLPRPHGGNDIIHLRKLLFNRQGRILSGAVAQKQSFLMAGFPISVYNGQLARDATGTSRPCEHCI